MSESFPHPIEAIHRARDALQQAVAGQARVDDVAGDLPAYGSAMLSTLVELRNLAGVLTEQISQLQSVEPAKPAMLDQALRHLLQVGTMLDTAVVETDRYWHFCEAVLEGLSKPLPS